MNLVLPADKVKIAFDHYKPQVDAQVRALQLNASGAPAPAFSDFVSILTKLAGTLFHVAEGAIVPGGGTPQPADKRDAVITAVLTFYQQNIEPAFSQAFGHPVIFNNFVEPMAERLLTQLIGGVYDALGSILTRTVSGQPATPAAPAPGSASPAAPQGFAPY